jgi:hypothetical protein
VLVRVRRRAFRSSQNLEVAFAYRASKGGEKSSRESNIHLLMEFFVGVGGWAQIPLPVWVQIEEIVGTVRVRLQLIPNYPFVSDTTISFMGVVSLPLAFLERGDQSSPRP